MRKFLLLLLLVSICNTLSSYSQLLDDYQAMLYQLPRTADDFQSKFFDIDLESAELSNLSNLTEFLGIPIMEHRGRISEMSFKIYSTIEKFGERELQEFPDYDLRMAFDSTGDLTDIHGNRIGLLANVPNSTRVGRGIRLGFGGHRGDNHINIEYIRDSQKRVVEAQVLDSDNPYLIFKYSYLASSNKISTIKCYNSNGVLIADVTYSYNVGRLSLLHYKSYSNTYKGRILKEERKKHYTYDSHGNYSQFDFSYREGYEDYLRHINYTFENQYNSQGLLTSSSIRKYNSHANIKTTYQNRKYSYDSKGNWNKIEKDNGDVIIRQFVYIE